VTGTTTRREEVRVANTVEVRGETLVVNVQGRDKSSMFVPTMRFPLDHVLGAEADPDIERKLWRAWVLRESKPGTYCAPDQDVRFYNPRHYCAHKAVVIRLQDETCERLVVEVEDPEGVVERVNRAVGAIAPALSVV
jgi:hypothetical protein